LNIGLL